MEILTKENLVDCSHCNFQDFQSLTKGNQVSLVRIHFSHNQNQMENRQTLGSGVKSGSQKDIIFSNYFRFDFGQTAHEPPKFEWASVDQTVFGVHTHWVVPQRPSKKGS